MAIGRIANGQGRIAISTGAKVGDPASGTPGCGCCCDCANQEVDGDGCTVGTSADNFLTTDSGVSAGCTCLAAPAPFGFPPSLWYDFVVDATGLGITRCMTTPSIWAGGPVVPCTRLTYNNAGCSSLIATDNCDLQWQLYKIAGEWRLVLVGSVSGQIAVAFDSTIPTTDPIDCCQSLHFTNISPGCQIGTHPIFGAVIYIGSGGEVFLTPCACP